MACFGAPPEGFKLKASPVDRDVQRGWETLTEFDSYAEAAVRLTSKGQVTIPIAVREPLGLRPGDAVEVFAQAGGAVVRRVTGQASLGERTVHAMAGRGTVAMTTDEILALTRD